MNRVSLFEANTNARAGKVDICVHALVVGVLFSTLSPPSKEEEGDEDEGEANKSPSISPRTTTENFLFLSSSVSPSLSRSNPGTGTESKYDGTPSPVLLSQPDPDPDPGLASPLPPSDTQVTKNFLPTAPGASTDSSSSFSARLGTPVPSPSPLASSPVTNALVYFSSDSRILANSLGSSVSGTSTSSSSSSSPPPLLLRISEEAFVPTEAKT